MRAAGCGLCTGRGEMIVKQIDDSRVGQIARSDLHKSFQLPLRWCKRRSALRHCISTRFAEACRVSSAFRAATAQCAALIAPYESTTLWMQMLPGTSIASRALARQRNSAIARKLSARGIVHVENQHHRHRNSCRVGQHRCVTGANTLQGLWRIRVRANLGQFCWGEIAQRSHYGTIRLPESRPRAPGAVSRLAVLRFEGLKPSQAALNAPAHTAILSISRVFPRRAATRSRSGPSSTDSARRSVSAWRASK